MSSEAPKQIGRDALARHVRFARRAAGLSIEDAAATVGMSPVTWGRVEKALPVRGLTYGGIERVLGWKAGSVEAVLAGGDPIPVISAATGDAAAAIKRAIAEVLESTFSAETKIRMIEDILATDDRGESGSGDPDGELP